MFMTMLNDSNSEAFLTNAQINPNQVSFNQKPPSFEEKNNKSK